MGTIGEGPWTRSEKEGHGTNGERLGGRLEKGRGNSSRSGIARDDGKRIVGAIGVGSWGGAIGIGSWGRLEKGHGDDWRRVRGQVEKGHGDDGEGSWGRLDKGQGAAWRRVVGTSREMAQGHWEEDHRDNWRRVMGTIGKGHGDDWRRVMQTIGGEGLRGRLEKGHGDNWRRVMERLVMAQHHYTTIHSQRERSSGPRLLNWVSDFTGA
eukprot:s3886_g8.t1